ncbi:MAG TPA: caspase family protein [Streptosporangiaceae bacterium]|nr:caspase family protein [Streptosporangiaceae bacterium]
MGTRHALLIGVPRCDDDAAFPPIPEDVVRADISQMARALRESDYDITVLGVQPDNDLGIKPIAGEANRNRCRDQIAAACKRVPEGGILLVYFSGHGVRLKGADFLVPSDFSRPGQDGGPQPDRLVSVNFREETASCRARLVVCFIDACRNRVEESDATQAGDGLPELPAGSFAILRGCERDQTCEWQQGSGSVFTSALARALRRDQPQRTLGEVLQAAKDSLRAQGSAQIPWLSFSASGAKRESEILDTVICEGNQKLGVWLTAVAETPLWSLVDDPDLIRTLREEVIGLVSNFGRHVDQAQNRLAQTPSLTQAPTQSLTDAWTDDEYPGRVLKASYLLLTPRDGGHPRLRPVEVATLIAAPFLREAVLALGLPDVPGVQPRDFTRHFGTGLRCDLENVFANHEQLTRRASGLAGIGSPDGDVLVMWLVHRWFLEREDLWERQITREWSIAMAKTIVTAATGHRAGEARTEEQARRLLSVIRCLTTILGPESERLAPEASDVVRVRPLGYLLSIAALLGADPRRMSAVLADHIGTHDPVDLGRLHRALATEVELRPDADEDELVVDAICDHPAVDAALTELAVEADEACLVARKAADGMPKDERDLLIGVPARCGTNLRPRGTTYDKPLLRFHLAGDRIRDLLMGTQLYGDDAAVAIREVYQNALDACRYRHMRLRYHHRAEFPPGWEGRIVMREGTEPDGRRYIECEDNGVGMTETVLRHVFTAAGTRFVHTAAFRREEARWRQVKPDYRLYPNSQFGIGVFSYFMLADEVSVWTAATRENGLDVSSRLHIQIPGPGGLLRLRRDAKMPEGIRSGGTVVRLYLSVALKEPAAKTLADYLVVAEYQVQIWRDGQLAREWSPGIPQYPGSADPPPRPGADGIWWVAGPGLILSDGLIVERREKSSGPIPRSAEHVFGRIINLTGPHQPRLSVDRTSILDWDRRWVQDQVQASIPALADWPGFTWNWLWSLMQDDSPLAQAAFDKHSGCALPIDPEPGSPTAPINVIGCFADDASLIRDSMEDYPDWQFAIGWRLSLWQRVVDRPDDSWKDLARPENTSEYPVLTPMDDYALNALNDADNFFGRINYSPEPISHTIERPELLYRLRRFVLAGLDLRSLRDVDDGDDPRLTAVAANLAEAPEEYPLPVLLLRIAVYLQKPLGEIAQRFRRYAAALDCELPESCDGPDLVPTVLDLRIVSKDLDSGAPWRLTLPDWIADQTATRIDESAASVRDRIAAYARIGFKVVSATSPDPPPEDDPAACAVYYFVRDLNGPPTPSAIGRLAFNLKVSERDAYQMIVEAAERLGLEAGPSPANLPADVPADDDNRFLARLANSGKRLQAVVRDRREYLPDRPSDQAGALYRRNAYLLDVPERITAADLVRLAAQLRTSVGHAELVTRELFDDRLDLNIAPEVESSLASLRPTEREAGALLGDEGGRMYWRSPPAAAVAQLGAQSASKVGEVLAAFDAYRPLGAHIPEVDENLAEYQPDGYDCPALQLATPPAGEIGVSALQLVRIAGRYGWTVRHAFDRLNRFRALGVELEPSREQCPEIIVHWADLIVLSEHLDGYDPALCGTVGAASISRAADAVREAPAQTRARLLRYADLFQLDCEELP